MTTPDDLPADGPPLPDGEGFDARDEHRLLSDLGALLDELREAPEVPGLDYDDIWRRIDRDIG